MYLRNCPYCGAEVDESDVYLHYNKRIDKWIFDHWCNKEDPCNGVFVTVYGKTWQEVIDKWNGVYEDKTSKSL